jgi:hypothetical protein
VQEHRHCIHGCAHLFRRLAVGEAQHISVQHGRPLLPGQIRERCSNLGHLRRLLHRVIVERVCVRAPAPKTVRCVERDRGEPGAWVARDRASLESALRIEERRLHHVLGVVMVAQLALDEPDQPAVMLPIKPLDLAGHACYVPTDRGERNDETAVSRGC